MHGCFVTLICIVHGRRLADQQRKKKLAAHTKADIKRQKAIEAKAVEAEKEAQRASELKLRLQLEVIREEDQLKQVVKDEEQAQTALGKATSLTQKDATPMVQKHAQTALDRAM